jgi:hypothetical protein
MNEQDWADRFSREVDSLLNEAGRTDSEPIPTEYRQALDLARILTTADFSVESRVRQALRRRLLNRIGVREGWQRRKEYVMHTFFRQRYPAVILTAVVLAAFLVVTLAWPGALTAAAQGIEAFVQSLWLGEHTLLQRIAPEQVMELGDGQIAIEGVPVDGHQPQIELRQRLEDERLTIEGILVDVGEAEMFAGIPEEGWEFHYVEMQRFDTIKEAQEAASFTLRLPDYLPEGYAFSEALVIGDSIMLHYDGPGEKISLGQTVVGEEPGKVVSYGVVSVSEAPVQKVTVNGQDAGWAESVLVWEADGISYRLSGPSLSLEEAIRIAESLE